MAQFRTSENDMLDDICYRYYGTTSSGVVESVLAANPGLAFTTVLESNIVIELPDLNIQAENNSVQLWD